MKIIVAIRDGVIEGVRGTEDLKDRLIVEIWNSDEKRVSSGGPHALDQNKPHEFDTLPVTLF